MKMWNRKAPEESEDEQRELHENCAADVYLDALHGCWLLDAGR